MAYVKIIYQNSPSTATPINAQNLNHMDDGIAENDRRLNELETAGVVNKFNGRSGNVTPEKGDYDIADIGATDGQDGYVPVWRNSGTEQEPNWGFEMEQQGGSGHTILDADGSEMAQEDSLQFADSFVSDDDVNGKTVIENIKEHSTKADYDDATEDGFHVIDDGEDAVIHPSSDDKVEVTADGDTTWANLLKAIFNDAKFDITKVSKDSILGYSTNGTKKYYLHIYFINGTTSLAFSSYADSAYDYAEFNGSFGVLKLGGTDVSSNKPTNGTKITLYYGNKKAVVDLQTTANRCLMSDGRTVENAVVVDVSDKFSASNNKLRISAQKHGKRITLSASGYDGSFSNGTYIIINDSSLYPNVTDGTYLGGGMGIATGTPATFITTDGYKTSNIILIYHSQDIAVNLLQFNVVYDIL